MTISDDDLTPEEELELERLEALQAKREASRAQPKPPAEGVAGPPTPPKKASWRPPVVIVLAIIGIFWFQYQADQDDDDVDVDLGPSSHSGPVKVIYDLSGTATGADITYTGTGGSTEQQTGVGVPLRTETGLSGIRVSLGSGDFAYLSAQNTGDGSITCTIRAGGVVVRPSTNTAMTTSRAIDMSCSLA